MRTKTIKLYSIDELTGTAKDNALNNVRSNYEYFGHDENVSTLRAFERVFPVNIKNFSYGDRGSGVSYDLTCDDNIADLSGIRLSSYIWNNYFTDLFKGKYYSVDSNNKINHKRVQSKELTSKPGQYFNAYHSRVQFETCGVLTGYCIDDDILKPVYDFLKNPNQDKNFTDLMEDCMNAWITACEQDLEGAYTDEAIEDHAQANEYEFTETGEVA
jgi:hypothetical protein